jgi:hypothetical protein
MLGRGVQEAWRVLDCGHDVTVDLGQQPNEAFAEEYGIIGHHHTHAPYRPIPELSASQTAIAL